MVVALAERGPALTRFMVGALAAQAVEITRIESLSGGAIQQNWAVDATVAGGPRAGRLHLVLRCDAPSKIAVSHSRAQEFAILAAAHGAGVAAPEPVALCEAADVIGRPFYLMARAAGSAAGHVLVRDDRWTGDRAALAERLGEELAALHTIRPPRPDLAFLQLPEGSPAVEAIAGYRRWLDSYRQPRPALEWGLTHLAARAPERGEIVLCHRDFRTGNYLVDARGLTAILDWEFAGWGDPMEDIGWFCARCWRFGADAREAGGIGDRRDFYRGYQRRSGRAIDPAAVAYWETMAHARWAVIALQQGERHVSGAEASLDLALTGRRVAELELELLRRTAPGRAA